MNIMKILEFNTYEDYVHLGRNLHIHYVQTSISKIECLFPDIICLPGKSPGAQVMICFFPFITLKTNPN